MKKIPLIGIILAAGFFLSALSFADDFIEVKGRGIFSGRILKESAESVTFVGPDGIEQTIARSEITMMEKGDPNAGVRNVAKKTPSVSLPAGQAQVFRSATVPSAAAGTSGITLEQIQQALAERARVRAESTDPTTKVNLWVESVLMMQTRFLIPDLEAFGKTVMDTIGRAKKKEGGSSYGTAGLVLGILGFIGLTVSGFMIIVGAFRCGIRWGLLLLTNGPVNFMAARFGEVMILVSHLWPFLFTYFIVTRFRELRKSVMFAAISMILLLSALVIVRIGFVSV